MSQDHLEPQWVDRMLDLTEIIESTKEIDSEFDGKKDSNELTKVDTKISNLRQTTAKNAIRVIKRAWEQLGGGARFCANPKTGKVRLLLDTCPLPLDANFWQALFAAEAKYNHESLFKTIKDKSKKIESNGISTDTSPKEQYVEHQLDNSAAFNKATNLTTDWQKILGKKRRRKQITTQVQNVGNIKKKLAKVGEIW